MDITRLTPQLTLDNCAQAIEWYKNALGARKSEDAPQATTQILHAELRIGNSRIMVNDPMAGAEGPKHAGGSPAAFWILRRGL